MTESATYVYREEIENTLDVKPSAYMARTIDRACQSATESVNGFCHRIFYPVQATRTFDYPGQVLRLNDQELVSASAITSDGVTLTDYLLRPDIGPPFDRIEIDQDGNDSFAGGPQRAVSITGLWAGAPNREVTETTLSAAIATTTVTTMDINTCPGVGVGAILRIDSERVIVTGKSFVTASTTGSSLTANNNSVSLTVTDGSLFTQYEMLLIESERVQVVDIAGNVLTLRRAVGGSLLAAHNTGAQIYWQHRLTIERGSLGTTAATHLISAPVYRWIPPASVASLARAYALDQFLQENSGYARTSGQGENERPVNAGAGIKALESRVSADYRRKVRSRAV